MGFLHSSVGTWGVDLCLKFTITALQRNKFEVTILNNAAARAACNALMQWNVILLVLKNYKNVIIK